MTANIDRLMTQIESADKAETALTNAYNAAIDFEEYLNPRGG